MFNQDTNTNHPHPNAIVQLIKRHRDASGSAKDPVLASGNLRRAEAVAYARWGHGLADTFRADVRSKRVAYPWTKGQAVEIADIMKEARLPLRFAGTSLRELSELSSNLPPAARTLPQPLPALAP